MKASRRGPRARRPDAADWVTGPSTNVLKLVELHT